MGSSNYNIILIFLCFSNLLRFIASSASGDDHNINYNEVGDHFVECLTVQLESSNSATDYLIYTPNNSSSSYASLLIAQNLRPGSTSPYNKPLIIFTPFYDYEIQSAIYCSKKLAIQIRVRSGGHDYEGLSHTSRDNPFVVVDMRNLRQISIDTEQKTAWVQVGATLGQLYHTLAQKSGTLAFTAGVCPTVGIGGHLSGGGYGMMSRRHSISADHIIDARIMNVDGEILDRRSMGEDLFWAIRGGGGTSFGIVIAFKVNLITVPETVTVFNVTKTYEQNATQLVHRWQYIADKVDENLLMRVFLRSVRSLTTGKRTVIASFTTLYLGGVEDLMPIMKEKFPELGLVEKDCTEMSWIQSVLYFAYIPNQPLDVLLNRTTPFTVYFKGKSDFATEPIPVDGLIGIFRFLREEDENMAEIQLSPYGGALNSFSESETPFPHRTGNIFMIDYGLSWDSPGKEEAEKHLNWMRRIYGYMAAYVSKSPRAAYFNYRDLDLGVNDYSSGNIIGSYDEAKVWGMKYFKNNFERLVRVKTKVDPSNFFRNEQSIPPFPLPLLYSS